MLKQGQTTSQDNLNRAFVSKTATGTQILLGSLSLNGSITVADVTINNGTANRVIYLDANKKIVSSGVTSTELGYLSGVTSAIQTQLNAKAATNGASGSNFSAQALYMYEWIRFDNTSATGLYWNNSGNPGYQWYIYPVDTADMRFRSNGGVRNGSIMGTIGDETARGYMHWTTSNEIGFLTNTRNWALRMDSNANAQIYGGLTVNGTSTLTGDVTIAGNITINGIGTQKIYTVAFGSGNEMWGTSSGGALYINYRSYDGTLNNFMNTIIGNGKGGSVLSLAGSSGAITTPNSTLDDGTGKATFKNMNVTGTLQIGTLTGDPQPVITARTIPSGQGNATERTELILFHANDNETGSGVDVITLRAPGIRLQTYNDPTVGDINNNAGSVDRLYIRPSGQVGIGTTVAAEALHVIGNIRTSGNLLLEGHTGSTYREGGLINLMGRLNGRLLNKNADFFLSSAGTAALAPPASNPPIGYSVYDNSGSSRTRLYTVEDDTVPNSSGRIMRVDYDHSRNASTLPSPGFGGFNIAGSFGRDTNTLSGWQYRAGNRYIFRVIAKIPVGRSIQWASNATGAGGNGTWDSSTAGTGDWQEYIFLLTIGNTSGTGWNGTGFFYITGSPVGAYTTWAASTAYALNALAIPTTPNGLYYKATVAGTSAATAPTWPTINGATVVDGGVTWTAFTEAFTWDVATCQVIGIDEIPDVDRAPTLNVGYKTGIDLGWGEIYATGNATAANFTTAGNYYTVNNTETGLMNGSGTSWFKPQDAVGNTWIKNSTAGKGIYLDAENLYFRTIAGVNRLTIDSSGNVAVANALSIGGLVSTGNGITTSGGTDATWGSAKLWNANHWGGAANLYPTVGGSGTSSGGLIMLMNPHVPYTTTSNPSGYTGAAKIRMAIDVAATNYWDIGAVSGDQFIVARGNTLFLNILNNGNTGIGGGATSAEKLTVQGIVRSTGAADNRIEVNAPTNYWSYFRLMTNAVVKWDIAVKDNDMSGALQFRPGGSTASMHITASGNVGINMGTTLAAYTLDVNGGARLGPAGYWSFHNTNEFNANGAMYINYRKSGDGSISTAGNTLLNFNSGSVVIGPQNTPIAKFHVHHNGQTTQAFYVDAGNMAGTQTLFEHTGVNTPVPFELRKSGLPTTAGSVSGNYGMLHLHMNTNLVDAGSNIYFTLNDAAGNKVEYAGVGAVIESNVDLNEKGALVFRTMDNGTGRSEKMRITSAGLVGIGKTATAYSLEVNGSILASSWIRTSGTTGWYNETYGGGWYMTDTSWVQSYNDRGVTTKGILRTEGTLQVGSGGTTLNVFHSTTAPTFSFDSGVIYGDGANNRVGINTTSPTVALDVSGRGRFTDNVTLGSAAANNIALTIVGPNAPATTSSQDISFAFSAAGSSRIRATRGGSWDTNIQFLTNRNGTTSDNPVVAMTIEGNGYVGIGTSAPAVSLEIAGSIRGNQAGALRVDSGYGTLDVGAQNASYAHIQTDRPAFYFNKSVTLDNGVLNAYSSSNLSFQTNATMRITVLSSNGNVGIGTASPDARLHVASGGPLWTTNGWNKAIKIEDGNAMQFKSGSTHFGIGNSGNKWYFFSTTTDTNTGAAAIYNMVMDSSGNIGIGNTAPTQKLDVTGNANISGTLTVGSFSMTTVQVGGKFALQYNSTEDSLDFVYL